MEEEGREVNRLEKTAPQSRKKKPNPKQPVNNKNLNEREKKKKVKKKKLFPPLPKTIRERSVREVLSAGREPARCPDGARGGARRQGRERRGRGAPRVPPAGPAPSVGRAGEGGGGSPEGAGVCVPRAGGAALGGAALLAWAAAGMRREA